MSNVAPTLRDTGSPCADYRAGSGDYCAAAKLARQQCVLALDRNGR
jgi:hypothetical protein